MKLFCYILFILPILVVSVNEEDLRYVRNRLKEYNERVNSRMREELSITFKNDANPIPVRKSLNLKSPAPLVSEKTSISSVNRYSKIADALFEGDIMLTRSQADSLLQASEGRSKRQAGIPGINLTLWDSTIPYTYDNAYPEEHKKFIKYGMDIYETSTCLKFKKHEKETHRLHFEYGVGCWSFMSKLAKKQVVSLGPGCETVRFIFLTRLLADTSKQKIWTKNDSPNRKAKNGRSLAIGHSTHEIGHALGFFHAHTRWDRDDYITVNSHNIVDKYISQFVKQRQNNNDNFGLPYDYGSVMHYDQFDTQKSDKLTTMDARNHIYQWTMGSYYASFYDVLMVNILYKCIETCSKSTTKCENGGYPNPNNCQQCNCPRGFGGKLCNERPKGCGRVLTATSEWQQFSDILGNGTEQMTFDECYYWIQAPEDTNMEIKLDKYKGGKCHGGCVYGGIEIKAQEDQKETGYRFCCNEPHNLVSNHSLVPIITYNRYLQHNATVSYRFVKKINVDQSTSTTFKTTHASTIRTASPVTDTLSSSYSTTAETTTTSPNLTENVRYCFDRFPRCQEQKELGFCTNGKIDQWYSNVERKYWCQLTCNLCKW